MSPGCSGSVPGRALWHGPYSGRILLYILDSILVCILYCMLVCMLVYFLVYILVYILDSILDYIPVHLYIISTDLYILYVWAVSGCCVLETE